MLAAPAPAGEGFRLAPGGFPPPLPSTSAAQAVTAGAGGTTTIEQELWRQSLLLAAQQGCGQSVFDLPDVLPALSPVVPASTQPADIGGFWVLRVSLDRSINVVGLRLENPAGAPAGSQMVPTVDGVARVALQIAEHYSRNNFCDWLRAAGLSGVQQELAGGQSIPQRLLTAAGSFQPAALLQAASELEGGLPGFPHPQAECLLARVYSELYLLSAHHPSTTPKRYLARALLYAQRAKSLYPGASAGQYALCYAYALCGCGEWALQELDLARMERPLEEAEPAWVPLLDAFLKADRQTLAALPVAPAERLLRTRLLAQMCADVGDLDGMRQCADASAEVDNDGLWRRCRGMQRLAGSYAPEASAAAAVTAIPELWRRERALLDEAERLYREALTNPSPEAGKAPAFALPSPGTYISPALYPLLVAQDQSAGTNFAARADAACDRLLPDLLQSIGDHPADPENRQRMEQARSLWPEHPGVALFRAVHDPDQTRLEGGKLLKRYAVWPQILQAIGRTYALSAEPCPPDARVRYPWSEEFLPSAKPPQDTQNVAAAYRVRAQQPLSWRGALQGFFFRAGAERPEAYREREANLSFAGSLLSGAMNKECVPDLTGLIRDGAGLGAYRDIFRKLLERAPEDAAANAWALHLRAALDPYEIPSYLLCARAIGLSGGKDAPGASAERSRSQDVAPAQTAEPKNVGAASTRAGEREGVAWVLQNPDAVLRECGSSPAVLLLADTLRAKGEEKKARELADREEAFYRLYARALENKPKGVVRGLYALALSSLTAPAALEYYDRLQGYLKENPQMSGRENYVTAAVYLSAARAASMCGQQERAATLLAQAMKAPAAGEQIFYQAGEATRDPARAQGWLLQALLRAGPLTPESRRLLEEAGAARLFPQVWK